MVKAKVTKKRLTPAIGAGPDIFCPAQMSFIAQQQRKKKETAPTQARPLTLFADKRGATLFAYYQDSIL